MFTQFVLNKTHCWVVWIYYYFVGMILPNLYSLLFQLLGQRYVVKESYGGSELGFSYCTWSSRIKKIKIKESHMTEQPKINKQNEDVSRPLVSTHRYKVNQSTHASLDGSTRETETLWWNHALELVLIFQKSQIMEFR